MFLVFILLMILFFFCVCFLLSALWKEVGESWLFYGCRDRTKDFLYESDFTALREAKVLHHYQVAFSREQAAKVYVQDRMQVGFAILSSKFSIARPHSVQ